MAKKDKKSKKAKKRAREVKKEAKKEKKKSNAEVNRSDVKPPSPFSSQRYRVSGFRHGRASRMMRNAPNPGH